MQASLEDRIAILKRFGASAAAADELVVYNETGFDRRCLDGSIAFPLADEDCVGEWARYAQLLDGGAGFEALAPNLVQLTFPIHASISQTPAYINVTRKGASPNVAAGATGLRLECPHECRIEIRQTWAGRIPLVLTATRADFVSLLRAFTTRNEPSPVPPSMGASIVAGYNNWSRFRDLRKSLLAEGCDPDKINGVAAGRKHRYQDRFILLSNGYYSGVTPAAIGLGEEQWRRISLAIRAEHECTHYWTRRVLSSMRNRVIDEIVADYCGIVAGAAHFRADWLLLFFGLEDHPRFREGGRLANYRGTPPLSDAAFCVLRSLVAAAAENLERFDRNCWPALRSETGTLAALLTLTAFTVEELASEDAPHRLAATLQRCETLCSQPSFRRLKTTDEEGSKYAKSA